MLYSINIDSGIAQVLSEISGEGRALGITWFLCGAYSRVILCEKVLGTNVGRATQDLDIGVCVESLQQYKVFRDALCKNGSFEPNRHIDNRLDHSNGLWIDIIPFGRFAEPGEMYHWGEDDAFEMNVMGFSDAHSTSVSLRINGEFEIKCAGYSGQFVLKLLAWRERHSIRGVDDARDLSFFLENAIETIPSDELYGGESQAVLEANGFDVELTSCFILGKRITSVFSQRACSAILDILDVELMAPDESELIANMYPYWKSWNHPEVRISDLLRQVRNGLLTGDRNSRSPNWIHKSDMNGGISP